MEVANQNTSQTPFVNLNHLVNQIDSRMVCEELLAAIILGRRDHHNRVWMSFLEVMDHHGSGWTSFLCTFKDGIIYLKVFSPHIVVETFTSQIGEGIELENLRGDIHHIVVCEGVNFARGSQRLFKGFHHVS